ncbi:Transposase IS200 like [Staphylococcus aureus]|nr:Transposase IS200 like [Staphylococcus aureus]
MFYNKRTQSLYDLNYYLVIATNQKRSYISEKQSTLLKRHFLKVAKTYSVHLLYWEYHDFYIEISFSVDKGQTSVSDFVAVFKSTSSCKPFWNKGYFLKTLGSVSEKEKDEWLKKLK